MSQYRDNPCQSRQSPPDARRVKLFDPQPVGSIRHRLARLSQCDRADNRPCQSPRAGRSVSKAGVLLTNTDNLCQSRLQLPDANRVERLTKQPVGSIQCRLARLSQCDRAGSRPCQSPRPCRSVSKTGVLLTNTDNLCQSRRHAATGDSHAGGT
jgi:hypothetical protein